jgi:hypothetical protein
MSDHNTDKPEPVLSADLRHKKVAIALIPPISKMTKFERFKMHIWNLILPPHIRLHNYSDGSADKDKTNV